MATCARGDSVDDDEDNRVLSKDFVSWFTRIQGSIAKSRKIRGGNYVQIATVDEGKPKCRTVVFRGFIDHAGSSWMKMITDARSEKVAQIMASPSCEMVWWFPKSSEQFRISGILHLVGPESCGALFDARLDQWRNLSDMAREQFYWMHPGEEFAPLESGTVPPGGRDAEGKLLPVPDSFLLMLLEPNEVKYLRLKDNYAQMDIKTDVDSTTHWVSQRVNP